MSLPERPTAVITGAGSGLGRALALALSSRRATLLVSDLDLPAAEETARLCRDAGASSASALRCDVTRLEEVEALAQAAPHPVDLVINNAGVASAGPVGELSLVEWRWTLEVDLLGVIHGCHVFVPRMKRQAHGHLLNIASAAGLLCAPEMAAYNVAKAGVVALSETLAGELEGSGVGVTVACPTFFQSRVAERGRFSNAEVRARASRLVTRGQPAEEVARAALRAVDRGALYCLPGGYGKWLWRLKRLAPRTFAVLAPRFIDRLEAWIAPEPGPEKPLPEVET